MIIHDFNTGADSIELRINEHWVKITKGRVPVKDMSNTLYLYIPETAGAVRIATSHALFSTAAPLVVVRSPTAALSVKCDGSEDNIYAIESSYLGPERNLDVSKIERPPGISFDWDGVGVYTRENRFFTAGGQRRESGWYFHSLKAKPWGNEPINDIGGKYHEGVVGISDVKWEAGVRDGEVVHYHNNSIEPLVVLKGAAIMLVRDQGKDYSFRQTPGMLYVPEPGEVHGILQVEASADGTYRHMCAQAPSKFHDPTDRVIVTGEGFLSGKTRDYLESKGIPPGHIRGVTQTPVPTR